MIREKVRDRVLRGRGRREGDKLMDLPEFGRQWRRRHSIANLPSWFANFSRQISRETGNILSSSPDVVVSDSRLSPIPAARLIGIPCVVILNQLKLLLSPRLREFWISKSFEKVLGELLGTVWS